MVGDVVPQNQVQRITNELNPRTSKHLQTLHPF